MPIPRSWSSLKPVALLLLAVCVLAATAVLAKGKNKAKTDIVAVAQLDEHRRAIHALNRLTFGPRPGDVARVEELGVDKWIEQQLHPGRIDDAAVDQRLKQYRALRMTNREMVENFPPPALVKAVMDGKLPMPSDPTRRAIYQAQIERLEGREELKQAPPQSGADAGGSSTAQDAESMQRREDRESAQERAESLLKLTPDQRYDEILRMDATDRRLLEKRLSQQDRLRLISDLSPEQRETVWALFNPVGVVQNELASAKLVRAVYSERQLEEVMTDFWFNHFNLFAGKGADRYLVMAYERDAIRPHVMGKFQHLLIATTKSPAMLFYLDNWMSVGPDSDFARFGPQRRVPMPRRAARRRVIVGMPYPPRPPRAARQDKAKKKESGLNENYARELMELHTLGVNGGYSQRDVTEVARVFTGWTLKEPRKGGGFEFDERKHEPGTKYVLGHKIKQHGEREGEEVLKILAHHPSTARFISTELAQRFVSDTPPSTLVNRMADTFMRKDGDIREVLRTMFRSPEFWSPDAYHARVKTPLEFVVSAVRASGAQIDVPMALVQILNRMGMPLYGAQPPTGYKTAADTWVNSAALLDRMNFAVALAGGRLPGVTFTPGSLIAKDRPASVADTLTQLESSLLAGEVSHETSDAVTSELKSRQFGAGPPRPVNIALMAGLLLGSPEFQRK